MSLQQDVKVKLLYWYIENGRSVVSAQRAVKVHYKTLKAPARNTIMNIVKRMEEGGTVGNKNERDPRRLLEPLKTFKKLRRLQRMLGRKGAWIEHLING